VLLLWDGMDSIREVGGWGRAGSVDGNFTIKLHLGIRVLHNAISRSL
jgi:hypothetical protein